MYINVDNTYPDNWVSYPDNSKFDTVVLIFNKYYNRKISDKYIEKDYGKINLIGDIERGDIMIICDFESVNKIDVDIISFSCVDKYSINKICFCKGKIMNRLCTKSVRLDIKSLRIVHKAIFELLKLKEIE